MGMPAFISENVSLAAYTTFRVGGPARYMSRPANEAEFVETLDFANRLSLPVLVLGGGSNLLVADAGVEAMVIRLSDAGEFGDIDLEDEERGVFRVGAAAALPVLVAETVRLGRAGLTAFAGIPGTVGGAAAMNAGSVDAGIGDFICGALVCTQEGGLKVLAADELGFGYRRSALGGKIALSFCMRFPERGAPDELLRAAHECRLRKKAAQPVDQPSAGCVFKNPEGISAGALLDAAGCKGMGIGGARVSDVHANFIVTGGEGGATSADIAALAMLMRKKVIDHVGIRLEPEIIFWGQKPGLPAGGMRA